MQLIGACSSDGNNIFRMSLIASSNIKNTKMLTPVGVAIAPHLNQVRAVRIIYPPKREFRGSCDLIYYRLANEHLPTPQLSAEIPLLCSVVSPTQSPI
jgi:hypothetical protein